MKWSISPWLCRRSLANSRCLDLEMLCARWGILSSFLSTLWEWKSTRSFDIFWAEKMKRYWCSNQSRVMDVVFVWSHTSSVHWRGFSSWCRFGEKGKMLGMVGLTGRFRANLESFFGDSMNSMYEDIQTTVGDVLLIGLAKQTINPGARPARQQPNKQSCSSNS